MSTNGPNVLTITKHVINSVIFHYVKNLKDFFFACKPKEEKNLECIKQNPRNTKNFQEFHKLKAITIATKVTKETMKLHNTILRLQRPLMFHTTTSFQPFNHQFENFMTNEKLAIQTNETCHMTSFSSINKVHFFYLEKKRKMTKKKMKLSSWLR